MPRRVFIAVMLAALAATAASASDEACTRDILKPVGAPAQRVILDALFEKSAADVYGRGIEVLVVRIGLDGKPVLACVDSAEAAKRFLETPIENVARKAREK